MDDTPKEETATMFRPIAESSTVEAESIKRRFAGDSIKMDQRFCQVEQSIDIHTQSGVSSARNCTHVDALTFTPESRDEQTIWKNLLVPDNHTVNINRYENAAENQKNQTLWTPGTSTDHTFRAKEHTNLATESKQSTQSLNTTPTSTTEVENFVNDKHQFSPKMEPISFDIDSAMNIPNPSHGTTKADQHGLFEDFSLQSTYPINQQFFDNDNNFADFNALPPFSQIKDDPCNPPSHTGEGIIGSDMMDYAQQSPRHSLRYNNELCKTPIPTTYADSQVWCQSTSSSENQRQQKSTVPPNGIHNAFMVHSTSNTYSARAGILPMRECLICGDEASGCHYGVLTCGSCKVFFKRAVEGHHNYLCAGRNDCIVDKIRRKNCPSCRLRKCYQAGMMLGGRKLKRFGALKAVDLAQSLVVYDEWQARASLACAPATRGPLFSPQILAVLESIEPEVVYAGHDNSQPELPHVLLNSLNRLCERQLLWIIRWSKSVPGFRTIHINDQMSLIQYSWMSLMVFSLGWRSFQNVTSQYLYFAPDLILNEERMRRSPIYDLCLAMKFIPQELANLQVTREEFLCMKALMLLNTVPAEGLKSQAQFEEVRQSYIHELTKAIHLREKGVVACSQRFYHLTKLMDTMHEIVKKVNLYCLSTFIQAEAMRVEFPEMMSEVITSQLPKVLAGTVKPLLFHGK